MSLMDKIKSFFSGGSGADAHDHAGHDHSGHDHTHEPAAPPVDPVGTPMSEPVSDTDDDRPA
jgi:hypothetical protein